MKKSILVKMLMCIIAVMIFSGCYDAADMLDDVIYYYSIWGYDIRNYYYKIKHGYSSYEKIDLAHKKAFDSVFEDIEIFGAKLCLPMKISELPDKFELYYYVGSSQLWEYDSDEETGWFPISEIDFSRRSLDNEFMLFYDGEISIAEVMVICKDGQSIEDGIIYEMSGYLSDQPVLLGGKVDISSDINEIKEYLGDGNTFLSSYSSNDYLDLIYSDGDRTIRLEYSVHGEDINFMYGSIKTIENYDY